jgi:hypothetical protein
VLWYRRYRQIPVELFPGDWCLLCIDPDHKGKKCHMLEMNTQPDGTVAVEPCGCDNSVTAGRPGAYVVRVVSEQKE